MTQERIVYRNNSHRLICDTRGFLFIAPFPTCNSHTCWMRLMIWDSFCLSSLKTSLNSTIVSLLAKFVSCHWGHWFKRWFSLSTSWHSLHTSGMVALKLLPHVSMPFLDRIIVLVSILFDDISSVNGAGEYASLSNFLCMCAVLVFTLTPFWVCSMQLSSSFFFILIQYRGFN